MKLNKTQRNLLIALIVGAIIFFALPASNGLTEQGVRMLSVFIPSVYLWITCGTGWTSFFAITMAILLKAVPASTGAAGAYATFWGNIPAAAVIPFLMVASVMEESGTFEWIVKWVISRKFIHGHPTLFMIAFSLTMVIISIFTAPQVVAVLFFRLLREVTVSIGYTTESKFYQAHGLLVGWISQTCDGVLPWGRPYIMTMVGLVTGLTLGGVAVFQNLTIMNFLVLGLPYLLIMLVVSWLVVKFVIRPDVSKFKNYDDAAMRADLKAHPISKRGKIASVGMIFILACYLLASLSFLGPVAEYLNGITIATSVTLVCALLCVITVDGKPVLDLPKAAAKVPWSMIFFLGAVMFFAGNIGHEDLGISVWLQTILGPIVSKIPVTIAMLLGIVVASLITNFCSNTVAGVVVCTSFVPALMQGSSASLGTVLAFACAVICICGTAFCTVSAAPTMGIVYSDIGLKYEGTAKYSVIVCAAMVLISTFVLIPLCSGFYNGIIA